MSTTPDLRQLRKERGLTLQQAANEAGLDASTLSRIERGEALPQVQRSIRLAATLGVEPLAIYASILAKRANMQLLRPGGLAPEDEHAPQGAGLPGVSPMGASAHGGGEPSG